MTNTPATNAPRPPFSSISVFFPCYNEEAHVARSVEQAVKVLSQTGLTFEVIVINDGSADRTAEIARGLAARDPRVKLVQHSKNQGYGAALRSGFKAATGDLVFFTDGDCQFDLAEMPPLLPLIEHADAVCCYRLNRQEGPMRRFNAWCWTRLVCFLFHMKVRDIDCAFKLFRREVIQGMELRSTGALISAEMLARATRKGCRIVQTGVHHYPRTAGAPTGARFGVIFRAFKELLKLRKQILKG